MDNSGSWWFLYHSSSRQIPSLEALEYLS